MVRDIYYNIVYLVIVSIITLFSLLSKQDIRPQDNKESILGSILITMAFVLFIGSRPVSYVFGDTPAYAEALRDGSFIDRQVTWSGNYLFQQMMAFLSERGASPRALFMIMAAINFGCTLVAVRKLFPDNTMLAMTVFFGAFSTFSAATNGLKSGCAAALFLVAIAYRDKRIISLLFLFLSLGFHHSMQLPILAYIACSLYKNTKVYLILWLVCLLAAASNITFFMSLFAGYTDEKGADYLLTQVDSVDAIFGGKTGFRIDFVLYSVVPIIVGYFAVVRKGIESVEFRFIYNMYLFVNAIWMLCMYAQYTNRIAYLSWFLYPVLIIYPFFKMDWSSEEKSKLPIYVVLGHLGFTLFMHFIYYA